jgi:hypothetical protein
MFAEDDEQRFTLTLLGEMLRGDARGALRLLAIELLGRNHYAAWEQLLYSVKTGAIVFDHVFGVSRWQYNAEHPEQASAFDEAMASFNSIVANAVVNSYDSSSCGKLVGVGGGNGSILAAILKVHPGLRGVLADLPHVLDGAQRRLTAQNVAERCKIVGADFSKSVPDGHTYLLKWIVHDRDDQRSELILKHCVAALNPGGRVLLVESIAQVPPISHEMAIAAPMHYAIGFTLGIVYLLVTSVLGLSHRSLITAVAFGLCTNLPPGSSCFRRWATDGMGCTVRRERACFLSGSVTHCFYGIGLWLGASIVSCPANVMSTISEGRKLL